MTNLQIKGGLPESLIYIKEKPMKKIKKGLKIAGKVGKELVKRTISQKYANKRAFGKK